MLKVYERGRALRHAGSRRVSMADHDPGRANEFQDELIVGPRGGIRVNELLQTSDSNIYAVGDAIEVKDVVSGEPTQIPLAGPANRQGRIAADNVFGRMSKYRGTQGTAIVAVFDRTAAMTGASEKVLRRANRAFCKVYVHPAHHAGYYPGGEPSTSKRGRSN